MEENSVLEKSHFDEIIDDKESELESYAASGFLRFINMLIDALVYYGIFMGVMFLGLIEFDDTYMVYVIIVCYYVAIEGLTGRSIGKLITGTKVVTENGSKPSFMNFVGRNLCRLIPFDGLSFLMKNNRGWHDSISKTWVVKSSYLTKG